MLEANTSPIINEQIPSEEDIQRWYVLRDLTRPNAFHPGFKIMEEAQIEWFTPMRTCILRRGKNIFREDRPVLHDLLFVHTTREQLDPITEQFPTLQYRYIKGAYKRPMTVANRPMEQFIRAIRISDSPRYYTAEEITPSMRGQRVRLLDGPLANCEGTILKIRGTRHRRILIEIPNLLAASVEMQAQIVEVL